MNRRLSRPVASLLIALMASNALSWVPHALADDALSGVAPGSASGNQITYNFSFDIPNHGVIDLYHNAYTARDRVSNSLYVLRNTAVEDLLNTRHDLKILLGGTEGARYALKNLQGDSSISFNGFDVPGGVIDLYLLGNLSGAKSSSSEQSAGEGAPNLPGPITVRHATIDTDSVPEIAAPIHWLGNHEPQYDEKMRAQLLIGLLYESAQITRIDQQLRFLEKDFWSNPTIRAEFEARFVDPMGNGQTGHGATDALYNSVREQQKKLWLDQHHMSEKLATLAGTRAYHLDRYHLLDLEVNGKPLYQQLYSALETVGFPLADTLMPPVELALPAAGQEIPVPASFEILIKRALDRLVGPRQYLLLSKLSLIAHPKVDQALLIALQGNTQRLAELTSEIEFDGSRSSHLLELAQLDDLWETAIKKYGYLTGIIDFEGARQEVKRYFEKVGAEKRHQRYTAYAVGTGLGVAATVMTAGLFTEAAAPIVEAAPWLSNISANSLMFGGGLITTTQAQLDYVDSNQAALVTHGLFSGTKMLSSSAQARAALAQARTDGQARTFEAAATLVSGLALLGAEPQVIAMLGKGRKLIESGGKTVVTFSKEELAIAREAVNEIAARAEKLAPLGRAMLAVVRNLLGMTVGIDAAISMEEAVPLVARQLKMAPELIWTRLEANPVVGSLLKGARLRNEVSKIVVQPTFLRTMVEQQLMQMAVSVVTEGTARGFKHMVTDELGDFSNDFAQGVIVTFALVYIGSPGFDPLHPLESEAARLRVGLPAEKDENRIKQIAAAQAARDRGVEYQPVKSTGGFFQDNEIGKLMKKGGLNLLVGVAVNGSTTSGMEIYQYIKTSGDPHAPSAEDRAKETLKNTVWGGLFMGFSSNLRYAGLSWVNNRLAAAMVKNPSNKIMLSALGQASTLGNNLFGGWSYVSWGKVMGFLNDDQPVETLGYPDDKGLDPKITGLQIEQLTGTYLRLESHQSASSYLFDFMQESEKAAPAPVFE